MDMSATLFELFGGIRPMARALGEPASNVAAWKRVGRIPAEKQRLVLAVAKSSGVPITAIHIIFPLGETQQISTTAQRSSTCETGNRTASTEANHGH